MDPNPRLENHLLPLTPLTPSLSELESLDTDSQSPWTPATLNILLEPVNLVLGRGRDEGSEIEEDEDLFAERDETIRLDPAELARLQRDDHVITLSEDGEEEPGDDDMFPSTAAPLSGPDTRTASRVPLPRSPEPSMERTIPGPPVGWKSTLSNIARDDHTSPSPKVSEEDDTPSEQDGPTPLGRPGDRRLTARTVSGNQPLQVKGRTVSGAMQYAIHKANAPRQTQQPASHPAGLILPEAVGSGGLGESPDEPPSQPSAMGLEDVSAVQQDEEIWMSYVRQQLATLFPDFFDPNEHSQQVDGPGSTIMARARQAEDYDGRDTGAEEDSGFTGESERRDEEVGWDVIQDRGHRRPWTSNPRVPSVHGVHGVTNVKDEIGGMKDEIERLREVVNGLASGMKGGPGGGIHPVEEVLMVEDEETEYGPEDEVGNTDTGSAQELKVPMTCAALNLIKSIDTLVHGQDRPNLLVFDDENLLALSTTIKERLHL